MHIGLFCKFNQKKGELSTTVPLFNKDDILRNTCRCKNQKKNGYEDCIYRQQECIQQDLQSATHIQQTGICK